MHVAVITPPIEVITLDEAKAHLRPDSDDEDNLIEGLIAAAAQWISGPDGWLGRSVGEQVLEVRFPAFGSCPISLPCGPVTSIESVTYLDTDGAEQTVDETDYELLSDGRVSLTTSSSWPSTLTNEEAVRVQYVAGHQPEDVPAPIKQSILLLVGHWFANREAVNIGNITSEVPLTVKALLAPYRMWSL